MVLQRFLFYIRGFQLNNTQGVDVGQGRRMPEMYVFASVFKDFGKPSRFAFYSWPQVLHAEVPMNSSAETQRFPMVFNGLQHDSGTAKRTHSTSFTVGMAGGCRKCMFSQGFSRVLGNRHKCFFFGRGPCGRNAGNICFSKGFGRSRCPDWGGFFWPFGGKQASNPSECHVIWEM